MDTLEAIKARRSIKHYDPDHKMSEKEVNELLSLAMLSPTAFNIQHWRFLVVDDPELRKKIREASWNQAQVTDASALIILCADLMAWKRSPERYWKDAPEPIRNMLVPAILQYYDNNIEAQRDECLRSCGIAAQTIMLAAKSMGYDTCAMDGFDFDAVAKLINLPDDHIITMFVVVGKAVEPARVRGGQLSMEEVVIKNKF